MIPLTAAVPSLGRQPDHRRSPVQVTAWNHALALPPVSPPKRPAAFPDLRPVRPKTAFPGGKRKRWKDLDGTIYEWDYRHGTLEAYNPSGAHLGEFDPNTGEQLKDPDPTRRIEP
jgi:hypothetical protein